MSRTKTTRSGLLVGFLALFFVAPAIRPAPVPHPSHGIPELVFATHLPEGGAGTWGEGGSVVVDAAGDIYVAGTIGDDAFAAKLSHDGTRYSYFTYLGGSGSDTGAGIAVDATGSVYVTGTTRSDDFPTHKAAQKKLAGGSDAFIVKLDPDGRRILYATYIGGQGDDTASSIVLDESGGAIIVGETLSSDFPVPPGGFQRAAAGDSDAFVARLAADGSRLDYSTLLGGVGRDRGLGVAVDALGRIHVAGATSSVDFPLSNPLQAVRGGADDAFAVTLSPDVSTLLFSTFLGGSQDDVARSIAVDDDGSISIAGMTSSTDFPLMNSLQPDLRGGTDGFVARLHPDGAGMFYSSFIGGDGDDSVEGLALDHHKGVVVAGIAGASMTAGSSDLFVSRIDPSGSRMADDTIIGGSEEDQGRALALNIRGDAYVTGMTRSADFESISARRTAVAGEPFIAMISSGAAALTCPGTINFDNSNASGLWTDPNNWDQSPARLPNATDDVCIGPAFSVDLSSGIHSINKLTSNGTLTVSGGTLTIAADSTLSTLTLDGGTIAGAGTIDISGLLTWTGGHFDGPAGVNSILNANGGININSPSFADFTHRTINSPGITTWVDGNFRSGLNGIFNNSGTFKDQTSVNQLIQLAYGGTATFNNTGTFEKTSSTTTNINLLFNNTKSSGSAALVHIASGTFEIQGGGTSTGGTFTGDAAATLKFKAGTYTLDSATGIGAANVVFDGGTVTLDGTYNVTGTTSFAGATVTFNAAATVTNIGSLVQVSSGTATLDSGSLITPTTIEMSGGTLGGSDQINISGLLTWMGGHFDGPAGVNSILNANGGININSPNFADFTHRTINSPGITTWVDGNFRSGLNGVFNNSGTFKDQTSANQLIQLAYGGTATFNNTGTFEKTSSTTTNINLMLNNTKSSGSAALVHVANGTLEIQGGGTSTGGTFTGDAATTLKFKAGTYVLDSATGIGATTVVFDGGTVTVDGTYNVTGTTSFAGATVTFNAAATVTNIGSLVQVSSGTATLDSGSLITPTTVEVSGGTLGGSDQINISGLLTWTGGHIDGPAGVNSILNANGGININSPNFADFTHRTINSPGITTWVDGNFRSGLNGVFNNSGIFKDQTSVNQLIQLAYGGTATFNNTGTFEKTSSTTTNINLLLNNTKSSGSAALVHVANGILEIQGGGTSTGGTFTGDAATTLKFKAGTYVLDSATGIGAANVVFDGGTVTMDGTYNVTGTTSFAGATVTFNAAATVTNIGSLVQVSSGSATLNSGSLITPTTMEVSGGTLEGSDQINISGLLTWTGGRIDGPAGVNSILNANGGININSPNFADFTHRTINSPGITTWVDGNFRSGLNGVFNNSGTFKDQTSVNQLIQLAYGGTATFNNTGTFEKTSSTNTTISMSYTNGGTLDVKAGVLIFQGSFLQTAGTTKLNGGAIETTSNLDIQGGSLVGAGTITGDVVCSGTGQVSPGMSPAILAIVGDYTQSGTGSFAVEIGGLTAGTQFDQVNLTGSGMASLGGTLNVSLISGFTPSLGNSFTIMNFASRTGVFTTQNLPALPGGLTWNVVHGATTVTLGVASSSSADLSITKSDSPDPVNASAALAYTLNVSNGGPDTASSVSVSDTLSAGVSFVNATGTGWTCNHVAGVVTCTRASLAAGAAPAITINVTAPSTGGGINNTATVTSATSDPSPANNTDSEGTTVNAPTLSADLSITKSDSPDPVNASAALAYMLSVSNGGPNTASSVSVSDTLPAGVSFINATGTGWTCNHASSVVTCTRASLAAGAAPAITINVTAPSTGGGINNTATVSSATSDPSPANNTDTEGTTVNAPTLSADLSITKSDSPDPVNASAALAYMLSVSNGGPNTASSVSVSDTLPAGVSFVNAAGTGWTCNQVAGVVTCTRASLAAGAAPAITINVTAPSTGGGINNTATVSSATSDPSPANNTDSEGTTVNPPVLSADLSITKTDGPDPVNASAALAYMLSVSNGGPNTASSVSVSDTLPAGVSFVNAAGTGWTCNHVAGVVTCTRASLAMGAAPAITINVTAPSAGGGINNTATVSSATTDPNQANNTDTEATTVQTASITATMLIEPRSLNATSEGATVNASILLSQGTPDPNTIRFTHLNGIPIVPLIGVPSGTSGTLFKFDRQMLIYEIESMLRMCTPGTPITVRAQGTSRTGAPFITTDTITFLKKLPCADGSGACLTLSPATLKMTNTSTEPVKGTIGLCAGRIDAASVHITTINGIDVTPIPGIAILGKKERFGFDRTALKGAILAAAGSCPAKQVLVVTVRVEGQTQLGDAFGLTDAINVSCGDGY